MDIIEICSLSVSVVLLSLASNSLFLSALLPLHLLRRGISQETALSKAHNSSTSTQLPLRILVGFGKLASRIAQLVAWSEGLAATREAVHNIFMSAELSCKLAARCQNNEQKQGIEAAASLLGLTTSKFILMYALKAAAAVLREHGRPGSLP